MVEACAAADASGKVPLALLESEGGEWPRMVGSLSRDQPLKRDLIDIPETFLTAKFAEQGASMVINCAPFGCMPGTLTSAIFQEIQDTLEVPMVTLFYDGEPGLNERLQTYLARLDTREPRQIPSLHKELGLRINADY